MGLDFLLNLRIRHCRFEALFVKKGQGLRFVLYKFILLIINMRKQYPRRKKIVLLFTWRALDTIANESFGTFTTLGLVWEVITAHAPTKIE